MSSIGVLRYRVSWRTRPDRGMSMGGDFGGVGSKGFPSVDPWQVDLLH